MSLSTNNMKWGCCELGITDDKYLTCTQCKKAYHFECLTSEVVNVGIQKCPLCSCTKAKGKNDNTPVRPTQGNSNQRAVKRPAVSSPSQGAVKPLTHEDVRDIIKTEMSAFFAKIDSTFTTAITRGLTSIKVDISELKDSLTYLGDQYENMKKQSTDNSNAIKILQEENQSLRKP